MFCLAMVPLQWAQNPLAAALLGVALGLRRLLVPAMVALAVLAGVLQLATGQLAYVADLAYPVLFYTLGRHPQQLWRRTGLVAAVIATLLGAPVASWVTVDGAERLISVLVFAAFMALFSFGGWLTGFARWQSVRSLRAGVETRLAEAEQRRLNEAYAEELERARIAADMHDVVAHSWAVVAAQADGARYALRSSPQVAEQSLQVIADTARATIADLRRIVGELRGQAGATTAPDRERTEELLDRMRASGMRLEFDERGEPTGSPMLQLTAHRVLGEALTNALKHGDLHKPVVVQQDWSHGYELRVTNAMPGPGGGSSVGTGHGLVGMAQRVAIAGGRISTGVEGGRFVVAIELPGTSEAAPGTAQDPDTAKEEMPDG